MYGYSIQTIGVNPVNPTCNQKMENLTEVPEQ